MAATIGNMSEKGHDNLEEPPPYSGPAAPAPGVGRTNHGFGSQQAIPLQPMYYGNQSPFNNVIVTQVGPGMGAVYQAPPYDYTGQAFFACLCCFWPTGLMAIMKASESRDAAARGDMYGAHQAANSARQMIRISYGVGVVSIIFACVFIGVYVGVIMNNMDDWNDNYNN